MKVEKLISVLITVFGVFLIVISLLSMYNDLRVGRSLEYYLVDLFFFFLGILITAGGFRLYRRIVAYEVLTEVAVEEILHEKLRPVLEQIAFTTAEMDEIKSRLDAIASEIRSMEEKVTKAPESPAGSLVLSKIAFYVKTMMFTLFFFGIYLFLVNFILPYEPFIYVALYAVWWVFITSEFKLFNRTEAWVVLCIPILIVPTAAIVLISLIGITNVRVIVLATAVLYAYLYYLYAKRLTGVEERGVKERAKDLLKRISK